MHANTENLFNPRPRMDSRPSGKRSAPQQYSPSEKTDSAPPFSPSESTVASKPVICFECGQISLVPQAAISARCHHCSAYIGMDDVSLHNRSLKRLVQTWGDVTIRPDSDLSHLTIRCKNLTILGKISGKITCVGKCYIRESQIFQGTLQAHTLEVDKRADVTFPTPVNIQQAFIRGILRGNIHSKGKVTICKNAKILGDVEASALIFEEGASHFGHFRKTSLS